MEKKNEEHQKSGTKRPRIHSTTGSKEDLNQTFDEAEELFSCLPFKQRWVGFLHTVSACLVTEKGAIIPWIKIRVHDMDIWTFYLLTKDEPNSTIQFSLPGFQIKKTPMMLAALNESATPSERYTTQLLMNYARRGCVYSTKFLNDYREIILAAPYFICETSDEACEKSNKWLETEDGMKFSIAAMGKHIPDEVPTPEHEEMKENRNEEEEFVCMICMDRPPSTCVHPCRHVVVCSACSIGLRATADKGKCVRCRISIESIEDLKSGETITV
ncbi:MAG: RING finger protein [Promethearchaeota archaeon]